MSKIDQYPNLSKSPIEVAIFEIRLHITVSDYTISEFLNLHKYIKDIFPTFNKGYDRSVNIDELPNGKLKTQITKNELKEIRFFSTDKKRTLLVNSNVFNLNISGGYKDWDTCFSEFQFVWSAFHKLFSNKLKFIIKGVSVRYINKFIFNEFEDASEYFNTVIYANEGVISGDVTSYLLRYVIQKKDDFIQINITQGLDQQVGAEIPYIIDLDVIYTIPISIDHLWDIFLNLRAIKNETFFSNITEKTLNKLL